MNDCQLLSPQMQDFSKILEAEAYQQKIPLHGVFELTARCNFNCNMCYVHLKEEQIAKIGMAGNRRTGERSRDVVSDADRRRSVCETGI